MVHRFYIIMKKRFYKIIIIRGIIFKPAVTHPLEHNVYLLVGKPQEIALVWISGVNGSTHNAQISTCQEKTLNSVDILVELLKYNLLIYLNT